MPAKSDAQLLRDYAEHGSEAAFREIAVRHTDLVYSAALRQMVSPDLARDVAQSVFSDLARKARSLASKITDDASLVGWLYRSTRFAALTLLRDDRRRQSRERQAMQDFDTAPEDSPDWERVRPVLDEAMANLSDEDRDVLLLRFFKNQDFRSVGAAIGLSDDAAQKRVARALEKLHAEFNRRGVTTTAVALSTALSANAVTVAPAGLAAALSNVALGGTTAATTATAIATKAIAMTATQKLLVATIVVASVMTPVLVQHRALAKLAEQDSALRRQTARLAELQMGNENLARLLAQANSSRSLPSGQFDELLRLRGQVTRLNTDVRELTRLVVANSTAESNVLAAKEKVWSERANQLKQWLEANPAGKIPELQFLTDQDWIEAIYPLTLSSDEEYRRAMSSARANAEIHVLDILGGALRQYGLANSGQFPSALSQLAPYFRSPVADAILDRYEIVRADSLVSKLQLGEEWVITQKAPVDEVWDARQAMGMTYGGMAGIETTNRWVKTH